MSKNKIPTAHNSLIKHHLCEWDSYPTHINIPLKINYPYFYSIPDKIEKPINNFM
ncbi:hypothetical protein DDI_2038 [Dickeya dianthicola RNS04.9]|nr:hypothetical protein DDI_2038 [Dickeya dianthicola RNS04.9]